MIPFDISVRLPGHPQPVKLAAGTDFRFDIHLIEHFFSKSISASMTDLLRIGMATYVADRLVRRNRRDQQRRWSRSIELEIGVLEPDRWNSSDVKESLLDCLEFLTDDSWDLSFVKDDRSNVQNWQSSLFQFGSDTRIALYSGGLDSAAGFANQIVAEPDRPAVPVNVWHQCGQRHIVKKQIDFIGGGRHENDINPLIFKAHLLHKKERRRNEENSQRSRAFLFLAAGAATAYMCQSSEVEIYESGVGAINLPLMAGMTGSRTTRSTHPEFLRLMSSLASTVAEKQIDFVLPFKDRTKGEVVAGLKKNGLEGLVNQTVSCVHFPLRQKLGKQCGVCPACLFRRQSILTAEIEEDAKSYKYDLFANDGVEQVIPTKELRFLKAYLMQVRELERVQLGKEVPDRILRHLLGTRAVQRRDSMSPFVNLFGRYRDEWVNVVRRADKNGYSWTKMLKLESTKEGVARASA